MRTLLIILPLLIACFTKGFAQVQIEYQMADFSKTIDLKGEKVETDMLGNPESMILIDSLLFIKNRNVVDFYYDIINVNNGKLVNKFGRKGRGPGEIIYPWSIQYDSEYQQLYVYDQVARMIKIYSLKAILANQKNYFLKSFTIDSALIETPVLMADNHFLCTLMGDREGKRFCIIDIDGNFEGKFGSFPDIGKEYPTTVAGNVFLSWVDVSPDRSRMILAYDNWEKIDIMDAKGKLLTVIKGPLYEIPYIVIEGENISLTQKAKQTFYSTKAGPGSFMVLYSGKKVLSQRVYKTILSFDYSGKPLANYKLEPAVYCIAVDWDKHIIYGINKEMEPYLCKFKF